MEHRDPALFQQIERSAIFALCLQATVLPLSQGGPAAREGSTEHPTQRRDGSVLITNCLISVGVAA
jgi:hypothetical protein